MSAAGFETQRALHAVLTTAIAGLTTVQIAGIGTTQIGVWDHVPQGSAFPYFTIGDDTSLDESTDDTNGEDLRLSVRAWSQYKGRKQVKALMKLAYDTLHNQPFAIAGQRPCLLQFERSDLIDDPDGVTRQGISVFRLLTFSG